MREVNDTTIAFEAGDEPSVNEVRNHVAIGIDHVVILFLPEHACTLFKAAQIAAKMKAKKDDPCETETVTSGNS